MTRRRIGVASIILLMIVVGVWAALPKYGNSSEVKPDFPAAKIVAHELPVERVSAPPKSITASAILSIGPHLPAGQLDPNEVTAWSLVQASLQQRGCGGSGFSVREMKSITSTFNANNISAKARELAEQYWQEYGAQMMANIGCT